MSSPTLNCYRNETDTFVATSAEHAQEQFAAHYRAMGVEHDSEDGAGVFELVPDDRVLEIHSDYDGETHKKTARGWIDNPPAWLKANEPGFLCTTEF